ncbi:MAG TPA: aldehyde dehydrogenase family protein [Dehalococcoidia bacterium]|nr:aldehyde dehydrogenase family protein [Dehalococcoidia bacterium]
MVIPNPSHRDGPPVGVVHAAGRREVRDALQIAVDAQPNWEMRLPPERAGILRRAAELLAERQEIVAAWEAHEAAKAWGEALADVDEAIDYLRFYAEGAEMLGDRLSPYRAQGVVAVIPPWNFPAAIPCGMTAGALVTGNAAVLKPAEQMPLVAYHLVRMLLDGGVPAGVLQWLPGRGEVAGAALVSSSQVDMVAFTGSAAVGTSIYQKGSRVRPRRGGLRATLAEMGGKNPILVFPDADLDGAVVGILRSAFGHSNQKCSAASRILIHRHIYDQLRRRLIEGAASLRAGPADEPGVVVTPLIDEEARDRVLAAGRLAASEGHVILPSQHSAAPNSTLVTPLLVEISAAHASAANTTQDEIFGPILALIPLRDEQQAIELANDTRYALTAGVFSRSPATIARVTSRLDAGSVYVNRPTTGARVGVEPFAGHRLSGTGPKAGGGDYLWAFVTSRAGYVPGRRTPDGSTPRDASSPRSWPSPPATRAQAIRAAAALLGGDWRVQWRSAASADGDSTPGATLDLIRLLLGQVGEIARSETTIALPGQQTHLQWDRPRGCGLIAADAASSLSTLAGFIAAALLAGNGALVARSRRHRAAASLLIRALQQARVPHKSIALANDDVSLAPVAGLR